jgi:hypothetical protein
MVTTTMQAQIVYVNPSHLLGKTKDGEIVFFSPNGEALDAKLGDTLAFKPEKATNMRRKDVVWFGRNPRLVKVVSPPPEPKGLQLVFSDGNKGLPDHNEKHFKGNHIIFGPRPCELEAQRRAFRNTGSAKHATA